MRVLLLFAIASLLPAADWLSASADPKHTRFQPAETDISKDTAADLKLLWKLHFDEQITAPVVLGPIFTHRGIKELVFFAGAGDNLYAVDADLARLFWKHHFDTAPGCGTGLTAAPVLAPYYGPPPEGDDASTPRRSLFVLTSDGQLHTVRPADAHDLAVPVAFVPAGSIASDLTLTSDTVSTDVTGGCAKPKTGTWRIRLGGAASVGPATAGSKTAVSKSYRVTATTGSLIATENSKPLWTVSGLTTPLAPVIANDLVFTVSGSTLLVIDLPSGRRLFTSAPNGPEPATASLALANGHVYFIAGQTVYCYGFPLEI